jgi:hypothetical protein
MGVGATAPVPGSATSGLSRTIPALAARDVRPSAA